MFIYDTKRVSDMKEFKINDNETIVIKQGDKERVQVCPFSQNYCTLNCPKAVLRDWTSGSVIPTSSYFPQFVEKKIGQVLILCGTEYYNKKNDD